jgi:hypothetical protein
MTTLWTVEDDEAESPESGRRVRMEFMTMKTFFQARAMEMVFADRQDGYSVGLLAIVGELVGVQTDPARLISGSAFGLPLPAHRPSRFHKRNRLPLPSSKQHQKKKNRTAECSFRIRDVARNAFLAADATITLSYLGAPSGRSMGIKVDGVIDLRDLVPGQAVDQMEPSHQNNL